MPENVPPRQTIDSRRPPIRAVAFDMDGLMFNTEDLYDQVGDAILRRRGHRFERDLKLAMMGKPGPVAFQIMRETLGLVDPVEQLQQECHEIFAELLPREIAAMPGLEALLEQLESWGLPKCIATSSQRQFARQALGLFGWEPRFSFLLTADDVRQGKPHPDIYLEAARRFQVPPQQMLVLEDSFTGSRAAAAAGALTIAVPTEHSRGQDFSHVHHQVESLADPLILELLRP